MDIATLNPTQGTSTFLVLMTSLLGAMVVVSVIWFIINVIGYWKLFEKASQPGWKSIIPIYNEYCIYKLGWNGGIFWLNFLLTILSGYFGYMLGTQQTAIWIAVMLVTSLAGFVLRVMFCVKLAQAYGQSNLFAVGLIFFYPIFILVLAFGSSQYIKQ